MNTQKITKLLSKAKEAYKREGIYHVVKMLYNLTFKKSYNFIYCKFLVYLKPPGTFTLQGQTYRYFYHPYNTYLDKLLKEGKDKIRFTEQYYLKRISDDNKWTQVGGGEAREAKYGTPFPYANVLVIGIIKRAEK